MIRKPEGFEVWTAWRLNLANGHYALITDAIGGGLPDEENAVLVGIYGASGESLFCDERPLADAVRLVREWKDAKCSQRATPPLCTCLDV